ncbi:MAG: hypothetical protein FWD68_18585, partial [Alphaproteobacteria bacterium]|nr:hypothetical protein [Alphaproteobacteria bacterium]
GSATRIAPGDTVNFNGGDNILVTQDAGNLTIATSLTPNFTSVTTGNSTLNSSGLTITGGSNGPVSLTDGGLDNGNNKIINVANGTASNDAVNYGQFSALGSTVNKGLNFSGGAGDTINLPLGETLTIRGAQTAASGLALSTAAPTAGTYSAGNIQTLSDNTTGVLQIQMAENPVFTSVITGNSTLSDSGLTIVGSNSTVSLTGSGLDNGNNKIINVANGTVNATSTDAINGAQFYELQQQADAGWNVSANGTNPTEVSKKSNTGAVVDFSSADSNLVVSKAADDNNITFALSQNLSLTSVTTGNSTLNTTGLTIIGGVNDTVSLTGSGLDNGNNKIVNVANGSVNATSTDAINGAQFYELQQQADAGWNVSANGTNPTEVSKKSNTGAAVDFSSADSNLVVSKTLADNNITFALARDLNLTSVTTGNSSLNSSGLTITGGAGGNVSLTDAGLDNGNNKIVNVAAGTAATDAVNFGQLSSVATNASTYLGGGADVLNGTAPNFTVQGTVYHNVAGALGGIDGDITNLKDGKTGPVVRTGTTDQLALVAAGGNASVPGNAQQLTNLANGTISATSTDAINGSQLYSLGNSTALILGGGATYNTTTGVMDAPTYVFSDGNFSSVGDALLDLDSRIASGNSKYFKANSTLAGSQAIGGDSVAIGPVAMAYGDGSIAQGLNAVAGVSGTPATANDVAIGTGTTASGGNSVALGNSATASGASAVAIGDGASAVGTNALALGAGASATNAGDVALGAGSATSAVVNTKSTTINGKEYFFEGTDATSTVSVGSSGNERTITNVAAGRISGDSTDAVNGSQLYATNQALGDLGTSLGNTTNIVNNLGRTTAAGLGGNAQYDDSTGSISAPTYRVANLDVHDVGSAISALQTSAPVQYSNAAGTPQGYTPSQDVTLVGADPNEPVVLHNVAAGVAPNDAVNVSQLQAAVGGNAPGHWKTPTSNTYVFNNAAGGGGPVTLDNIAPGAIAPNSAQAVNGAQLYQTNLALNNLAAFTAQGLAKANAGAAAGIATGNLVQAVTLGKSIISGSVGYWNGQTTLAFGMSHRFKGELAGWTVRASGAISAAGNGAGGGVGLGYEF